MQIISQIVSKGEKDKEVRKDTGTWRLPVAGETTIILLWRQGDYENNNHNNYYYQSEGCH